MNGKFQEEVLGTCQELYARLTLFYLDENGVRRSRIIEDNDPMSAALFSGVKVTDDDEHPVQAIAFGDPTHFEFCLRAMICSCLEQDVQVVIKTLTELLGDPTIGPAMHRAVGAALHHSHPEIQP